MSVENRRLILKAGISALALGAYKTLSPETALAQNKGSQPRTEPPTPIPSPEIPAPKPPTLIDNPAMLAYIVIESTVAAALAAAMIRISNRGRKR